MRREYRLGLRWMMGSYGIPEANHSLVRYLAVTRKRTNFEIAKERVHEEIKYDEWRKYGIEDAHEDKPSPKPAQSSCSV